MAEVLIVIHLLIVLALVGLVLLQKSEGGGLGIGGSGGLMSTRGTGNVLTRTTSILAALFFLTSITLSVLGSQNRQPRSILDTGATPSGPLAPTGQGGGILDQLNQLRPPQPATPQPDQGPQAPLSR